MIYQRALCEAASELGIEVHQCRRGEEIARAAASLRVAVREMESFVSVTGRLSGPPWTEEPRRAYAGGIAVLAASERLKLPR